MNKIRNVYIFCIVLFFINPQSGSTQINFTEQLIDNNTDGTSGIYATDLDNDSDIDVLAANSEDNQIIWFRNDGGNPINWTKIIIGGNVGSAHSVYAADFDDDGDMDVVGAAYWGTPGIAWWRNDGGNPVVWTKFTVAQNFINAHEVYAHDLDKDNDIDILGASSDLNTIAWWRNDGGDPVVWTEQVLSDNVTLAKSVHVGDFDDDGDNDVVGASIADHDIIWWRNDGGNPIQWTEFLVVGNFIGAHRVEAIDMDDDGDDDILGAGYLGHQIAWWRNEGGNPITWSKQLIAVGVLNACVAVASDLDNDEDLDVIATAQGEDEVSWWRNDGNGSTSWTKFTITDNFTRPWPLFVIDMNNDEFEDIIVGSSYDGSKEIMWWENDGLVSISENFQLSGNTKTLNCYPNPFISKISMQYQVQKGTYVKLEIANVFGQEIIKLVDKYQDSGIYTVVWDRNDNSGHLRTPGIFICKLHIMDNVITHKLLLK